MQAPQNAQNAQSMVSAQVAGQPLAAPASVPGPGFPQQQTQGSAFQQVQNQQQQGANMTNFAAAPAQQQFQHQGLNGGWQSDKDYQDRRKMIGKIVLLLQQRKPNAPQEWLKKLPQMAKRLEESLYRSAKSFQEYNDANTLKHRLQQLAVSIGMKTKKMQQEQILQHQIQLQQQVQMQQQAQQQAAAQQPNQQAFIQQQTPAMPQQPQQQLLPAQPPQVLPAPQVVQAPAQLSTPRVVNMADINPLMSTQQQQVAPVQQVQYTAPTQQIQPQQQAASTPAAQPALAAGVNGQVSDRQQVLRHQQQRLLLLRHAAKCQHEDNQCPVTPHCAGMKRLWKHIAECKNQKCLVPHCVSSRYVLSHYHRCKDVRCPVCGPVREAIHRSHEKQKHMQALKQRHQQAVQQSQVQPGTAVVPSTLSVQDEPAHKRQKTALQSAPTINGQARPSLLQPTLGAAVVPSTVGIPVVGSKHGVAAQVSTIPGVSFSNGQVILPKISGPKPQEDHTLINCFTVEQIEKHIASLSNGLVLAPQKLKTKAMEVLKSLQTHQHAWVFNTPVDPVELGLPDYFEVIKHPMDLGTVRKKLENGVYHKLEEFEEHVLLTFDNAMLYNPEGSVVYNMAKEMKEAFANEFARLMDVLNAEEDIKRRNGEACLLCGCEKMLFEPPVFYCNGLNCPSKRIRRGGFYYVAGNNQYHWCHQCFQDLRDGTTLDLGDVSIKKESLVKKKNDEVHEESWVQCDRCERWVHQICALFNTRQNKDQRSEYACPRCTIDERKKRTNLEPTSTTPMAEDLPRTKLSEYLEQHVRVKVDEFLDKKAITKAAQEGTSVEVARKKIEMGGAITIRQVTSMDRKLEVRERMLKRYAFKNYPEEFNFRCKCIVVFQNLDGVDVILFGLYVYEHDEKNPAPNTRTVYVSYLDSVYFMRPRQMRTFIYHEILIAYLDYVRRRGFATAHIWACPPLKGDDYILYAKPEDQKVPKDDRLRQWYIDMLVESQRRGVVGKVTNMYDLYFADPTLDATAVPYMEGDYFPAEAENIIKDIQDGKAGKKVGKKGNAKGKAKQKKKSGRSGTRSAGLDEESFKASGVLPPGADPKSLEAGTRDYVMVKLGETIQPMKESFIVAYLAWNGAREEDMVVPKEIQEFRDQHGITWKLPDEPAPAKEDSKDEAPSEKAETSANDKDTADMDVEKTKNDEEPTAEAMDMDEARATETDAPVKEEPVDDAPTKEEHMNVDETNEEGAKEGDVKAEDTSTATTDTNPQCGTTETSAHAPAPESDAKKESAVDADAGASVAPDEATAVTAVVTEELNDSEKAAPATATEETSKETLVEQESAPTTDAAKASDAASTPEVVNDVIDAAKASDTTGSSQAADDAAKASHAAGSIQATGDAAGGSGATAEKDTASNANETKEGEGEGMQQVNLAIREGKFAAMAKKRDISGEPKEPEMEEKEEEGPKVITVIDSKGRRVKVLDDDAEELDCEFLNNRQAFLNLCQGNHYQFDQLRRAKHSSMMVLWHLHNRDAPKFVQQCATCSREILSGYRLHCPICSDFDQCPECYQNPNIARHIHQLKAMTVASGQQNELTEAQRKERQRSVQLHMTLLLHAATCNSSTCPSANCTKMKGLLKHGTQCQIKASGGCNVCKRIWALLQIHARQCKAQICPVPSCMAIRERVRQLKKQQQAMDDRRRQEMNRAYGGKR